MAVSYKYFGVEKRTDDGQYTRILGSYEKIVRDEDGNLSPEKSSESRKTNLLYILNLPKLSGTTKQKSPNMGKK